MGSRAVSVVKSLGKGVGRLGGGVRKILPVWGLAVGVASAVRSTVQNRVPVVAGIEPVDPKQVRREAVIQALSDAIRSLPSLLRLMKGLLGDPRVPRRSKMLLGFALAYTVSPVDLIPEVIPILGFADDLVLIAFALSRLMATAGEEVVLEHWDGPVDLLELIRSVVEVGSDLLPARVRVVLARLAG